MVKPIPDGYAAITPHLVVKGGAEAIEYYKRAFAAVENGRMPFPGDDGETKIGHAELRIGDSRLFLSDECREGGATAPSGGGSPVTIHLYVTDVDATFKKAVDEGATPIMPPADMFWGDRYGKLADPFGHHWSIASHKEDLSPEQIQERMAAFVSGLSPD